MTYLLENYCMFYENILQIYRLILSWLKSKFTTNIPPVIEIESDVESELVITSDTNVESDVVFIEENSNMKKVSLHMGICRFSKEYYGPDNDLNGCENDAIYIEKIAKQRGFETNIFLSEQATYEVYVDFMKKMTEELVAGDMFFFTISCHGTFQDYMEKGEEKRKTALCLHDRIVWDYETKQLLMQFKEGVRIVWMADCCHARDNFKSINNPKRGIPKFLDFSNIRHETLTVKDVKNEEDNIEELSDLKCSIVAYSSSTEQQVSYDFESFVDKRPLGLFTASIEKIMLTPANGKLSYYQLYKKIIQQIAKADYPQTPQLQTVNGRKDKIAHREFLM